MPFKPGDEVRKTASDRTGVVTSFRGRPVEVRYDDDPVRDGEAIASNLLREHAALFLRARRRELAGRTFTGHDGRSYSLPDTLKAAARDLTRRGDSPIFAHEAAVRDLRAILAQRAEWDDQPEETS